MKNFKFHQIKGPTIEVITQENSFKVIVEQAAVTEASLGDINSLKGLLSAELASYNPSTSQKTVNTKTVSVNAVNIDVDDFRLQAFLDALEGLG